MDKSAFFLKNNIAYIYRVDSTSGVAFKNLLENNNCHVTLIEKNKAGSTDYSHYKLIVIDHNTDGIGAGLWKSKETDAIKNADKPILLMGMGGLLLAENWAIQLTGRIQGNLRIQVFLHAINQVSFIKARLPFLFRLLRKQ